MLKLFRSAVARRITAGFTIGAAAMLMIQPVEKPLDPVSETVPTLATLT